MTTMKLLPLKIILPFIMLLVSAQASHSIDALGEYRIIKGEILDRETKEPLIGATVYVEEYKTGTATDLNGKFKVKLPEGKFTLTFSYIGYKSEQRNIQVSDDVELTILLGKETKEIEDVVVTAERSDENITRTEMSVEKMKIQTIRQIPALMGEVDVIKAIQLLPGVQAAAEGASGFSVRGGNIDQNLILLDESTVYNVSHLMGFFSVFNNDAVDEIKLYKGDIPAAYGGRLSSLLKVDVVEGDNEKWNGRGGLGTISSRLTLDGPITEDISLLVAGRRSYADIFLPFAQNEDIKDATLFFYDLNAKLRYKIDRQNTVVLSGYNGKDEFGNQGFEFGFGNTTGSVSWMHTYNENVVSKLSMVYSNYGYKTSASFDDAANMVWTSKIRDYGFRLDNTVLLDDENTVKFGFSSIYHKFFPGLIEPGGNESMFSTYELNQNSAVEWGVYGSNTQEVGENLTLKYGLRFSIFQNVGPGTVYEFDDKYEVADSAVYTKGDVYNVYQGLEPRLGIVYQLNDVSSVKASYSRTRQYIHLASNSAGGTPLDIWFASNPNVKPQVADQAAVGYFRNFWFNQIEASVETYYKKMNNTIDFKDHAQLFLNQYIDGEFRIGDSWSYGAEFLVKLKMDKLNGWVSYTLSKTIRDIPEVNRGNQYVAPYDKPHDVGIVLNYALNKRVTLSANWVYSTGTPMTIPSGSMVIDNVQIPTYTDRNSYRMPDYHRLDLGVTLQSKNYDKKWWKGEWNFSVYNAYGRHNAWTINFREDEETGETYAEKTYLFSFVPSVTYNFKF